MCTKSRAQGVCDGRTAPNKEIGRFLSDTLAVVPRLGAEQFGALFNDSVQDVLLVRSPAPSSPGHTHAYRERVELLGSQERWLWMHRMRFRETV